MRHLLKLNHALRISIVTLILAVAIPQIVLGQTTPTPTPTPSMEERLRDTPPTEGTWTYTGPVSGLERSATFYPGGVVLWNVAPEAKDWSYYTTGSNLYVWDADLEAVLILDSWGLYAVWEIVEYDEDEMTVLWWDAEDGYGEEPVVMTRD